ncbi:hypothetical protein NDU88_005722 [Pleurodeles waltl]|uniref:Trimeric intracellular cation channel type B n=1 Tax=Pleurodeles waltl TaxID=8319 RepID=A0AAV7X229_PLEWA|nr:hypothetical protein NDU88_005722 [Pleurodeles waltl]
MIPRVAMLLRRQAASAILITPLWRSQPWFPSLLELSIALPLQIPIFPQLLLDPIPPPCIRHVSQTEAAGVHGGLRGTDFLDFRWAEFIVCTEAVVAPGTAAQVALSARIPPDALAERVRASAVGCQSEVRAELPIPCPGLTRTTCPAHPCLPLAARGAKLAMELLSEVSLEFSRISMFPFFELAHYLVSVMTLREQAGAEEVARRSPVACWFSAMLYCFGGALLSAVMLAEPPVLFLTNEVNIFMASATWFLVFFCPGDIVYQFFSFLPVRVVIAGMKEMTRTRKILAGVAHANSHYSDAWMVMIAVGWAKGAGGGLISNFEQLVRGVWKPEHNELLKMSYPVKVTLIGSVLFTLQHTQHLSITKHNLVFLYSIFLVVTKVVMMVTGSAVSPFAPFESLLSCSLFHWKQVPQKMKREISTTANGTSPTCKDLPENGDCNNRPASFTNAESLETTRKRLTTKAE